MKSQLSQLSSLTLVMSKPLANELVWCKISMRVRLTKLLPFTFSGNLTLKYRVSLIAIVICLLGLATALVYAQNARTPTGTPSASSVIQQDIFVRGGPGRDYLPVGKLWRGIVFAR